MHPRLIPVGQRKAIIIDEKFGELTVLGEGKPIIKLRPVKTRTWRCRCSCGKIVEVPAGNLRAGNTTSCGHKVRKHGESCNHDGKKRRSPVYKIWGSIIQRCTNPNDTNYHKYGGNGRKICHRYHESFVAFRDDLGPRTSEYHEVDRKDNAGGYTCGQCEECLKNGWTFNIRWATPQENGRNKSTNRVITYKGETLCIAEWAERYGMLWETLWSRIKAGWSIEEALTKPVDVSHRTRAARDKAIKQRRE